MAMLQAVLPVLVMLFLGMLCREKKLMTTEGTEGLQALVMNFSLPFSLFANFYKANVPLEALTGPVTFFVVTAGGIFVGKLLCKVAKAEDAYLPFMLTGYEAGMLGYALLGILIGTSNITRFALMDMGHCLAIFTVYVAMLKGANGKKQTVGEAIKGMLTTPVLVGILLGLLFCITGVGSLIANSSFGPVLDTLCSFISAPTSAAILIVIGYRMNFKGVNWKGITKAIGLRLVEQIVFAIAILGLFHLLGGILSEEMTIISVIVMLILPPPFILPMYAKGETQKEFYSSAISVYTAMSIIGFIIMAGVVLL